MDRQAAVKTLKLAKAMVSDTILEIEADTNDGDFSAILQISRVISRIGDVQTALIKEVTPIND